MEPTQAKLELETVKQTKVERWKWFIYMMMSFAFLGPTMILGIWNYILFSKGWTYPTAAVSRVISIYTGDIFYVQLAFVVPALLMTLVLALVRNIQVHVYFVNEAASFGVCWRYLNFLCTISFIIGVIGVPLLIAFNSTDDPVIHIVFAGQVVIGFFFGEFFWGIITLRYRIFCYQKTSDCKQVAYFIDAIWYILVAMLGMAGSTIYVVLYQSTGTNITDSGEGIDDDYYKYQWLGVMSQLGWCYMNILTIYIDQSDDELQLFFKNGYFYITKGLCDVHFSKKIRETKETEDQTDFTADEVELDPILDQNAE